MNESTQNLFSKAQLSFASERYDTVIDICTQILKTDATFIDAIVLLGNAYLVQNQFDEAERCFKKATEVEPNAGEHYFNLGNSLFGQQRLAEAMSQYAKAIQLGCRDEMMQKIYYIVGIINQIDGKNTEALMNYDKSDAIAGVNVDQADILLKRIQIYVEQNNLEKAENCAIQLKLLVPDEFKSYQLLFQLYLEQRKISEASAILDEAEKYCENSPDTKTEITFDKAMLSCFKAEQFPERQTFYYQEALAILSELDNIIGLQNTDKCEALITRADIYLKLEKFNEAKALAESVIKDPLPELVEYVERAHYIIIKCLSQKKDFAAVRKYAERLKASENIFFRHYGHYAEAYAGKQLAGASPASLSKYIGQYNYAIAYYKNCTVSAPGDFLAYLYRAKCYVDIGKFEKADAMCRVLPLDAQTTLQNYIQQEKRRWND